jgi:signal transduction histidine kinase
LVQNAAQAGAAKIEIRATHAPGGVATVIAVTDDGPGIAPGDRTKIFDPFYTTKAPGTGTGLGLAVCKHLVATAGGTIEVGDRKLANGEVGDRKLANGEVGDAKDGRGVEFRVVIPNAS